MNVVDLRKSDVIVVVGQRKYFQMHLKCNIYIIVVVIVVFVFENSSSATQSTIVWNSFTACFKCFLRRIEFELIWEKFAIESAKLVKKNEKPGKFSVFIDIHIDYLHWNEYIRLCMCVFTHTFIHSFIHLFINIFNTKMTAN